MTGSGLTDVDLDAVVDQLVIPLDERPLPSALLARREACRTVRHILKRDSTTTSRLAVPLARTLAETIEWPASDTATAVFNLNRIRNDIQRTATSALAELDAWRLCIGDQPQIETVLSILSPLAISSDLPDDIVTVVAAIFERACICAPDAVQSTLDPQYLVSSLASSQSNRNPSCIHPARFQLLVALLHAAPSNRTVDGVEDILEIARSAVDPVVASRTALAAALPSLDYPDDDDDVIARCCEAIPAVTWDAAEGTVTSPSHLSKEDPQKTRIQPEMVLRTMMSRTTKVG